MFNLIRTGAVRAWFCLLVVLASGAAAASVVQSEAAMVIKDFTSVDIPDPDIDVSQLILPLSAGRHHQQLELHLNQRLLSGLSAVQRRALRNSEARFYTGKLTGKPTSWVRLSWLDGGWQGGFFDGEQIYLIEQAGAVADALPYRPQRADATIMYRLSDLLLPWPLDDGPLPAGQASADATQLLEHLNDLLRGDDLQQLPITIVTDTQFNNIHGVNTAAVVMARVNFVAGLYINQVGVSVGVAHLEQLAANGPLTSLDATELLFAFRDFIVNGTGGAIPQNGVAHLFTGRNINGTTVGIAFLGVLCSNFFGYGVDQNLSSSTTSALVFAHELGHNFNAPHDGEDACVNEPFNGIMNPSINGSQTFSDCSLAEMAQELASASCLISAQETILENGFESQ